MCAYVTSENPQFTRERDQSEDQPSPSMRCHEGHRSYEAKSCCHGDEPADPWAPLSRPLTLDLALDVGTEDVDGQADPWTSDF